MKKWILPVSLVLILIVVIIFSDGKDNNDAEPVFQKPRNGVAVLMTGAAARIPQEAALLEELDKRGLLKNVVFISGVSSGALNAVALNGILSKKMTWEEYKKILYNIRNDSIYHQEGKKLPVNSAPARALYTRIVQKKLDYHCIGELPYTTAISFTHLKDLDLERRVYRMCSRKINKETDTSLSLVDIMMASSAFPIVFPPVRIKDPKTIPDVKYVDGGVGEDHVPFKALLEFEQYRGAGVEKVYIVSRQSDSIPEISEELKDLGVNDKGLFDDLGISLDDILKKGIIKRLKAYAEEAPELVSRTYVWTPNLNTDFLLFDFDDLRKQYELTAQWP